MRYRRSPGPRPPSHIPEGTGLFHAREWLAEMELKLADLGETYRRAGWTVHRWTRPEIRLIKRGPREDFALEAESTTVSDLVLSSEDHRLTAVATAHDVRMHPRDAWTIVRECSGQDGSLASVRGSDPRGPWWVAWRFARSMGVQLGRVTKDSVKAARTLWDEDRAVTVRLTITAHAAIVDDHQAVYTNSRFWPAHLMLREQVRRRQLLDREDPVGPPAG